MNIETKILYWKNGKPKRETPLKNGLRHGFEKIWNDQGTLLDLGEYQLGEPVGRHQRWNDFGALLEETHYLDESQKNVSRFDESGKMIFERIWKGKDEYFERTFCPLKRKWLEKSASIWEQTQKFPKETGEMILPFVRKKWEQGSAGPDLFQKRFPALFLSLLGSTKTSSDFEALEEVALLDLDVIYVFGLGKGAAFFQLEKWLEKPKRRLIFLEESPGAILDFIESLGSYEILSHPQVEIGAPSDIDRFVQKFPFEKVDVFSLPSKKGDQFDEIKLEILRKSALSFNLHKDRFFGEFLFSNFLQNVDQIQDSFYVNALRGAFSDLPVILCGAGPSLDDEIETLKSLSSKALIIAAGSAITALSQKGVPFHLGVAIDPNLEEYRRLKNSLAFNTPLIYSTRLHPNCFQTMGGPFGYMRSGVGGILELWIEEALQLDDPLIGLDLSHEALSVTTISLSLALYLGAKSVHFVGVDLAYVKNRHYASEVKAFDPFDLNDLEKTRVATDQVLERTNNRGEPVLTATRWVMEASCFTDLAKKNPEVQLFNASLEGQKIENVSFQPLKERVKGFSSALSIEERLNDEIEKARFSEETGKIIQEKMRELKSSLEKSISHLEVLSGEKKGSKALAEIELEDELARDLLFYDAKEVLSSVCKKEELYQEYLAMAQRFLKKFESAPSF